MALPLLVSTCALTAFSACERVIVNSNKLVPLLPSIAVTLSMLKVGKDTTSCASAADVLTAWVEDAEYAAVKLRAPELLKVMLQANSAVLPLPALAELPAQVSPVAAVTCTWPSAGCVLVPVTATWMLTAWPTTEGSGVSALIAVLLASRSLMRSTPMRSPTDGKAMAATRVLPSAAVRTAAPRCVPCTP